MGSIVQLKTSKDNLDVEYEIISYSLSKETFVNDSLNDIESRLSSNQDVIDQLNIEIGQLTNHSDSLDYTIAVASGILTGLIDAFFIREFNYSELKADANKHVNHFVEKYARLRGYVDNGRGLKGAIEFLEKHFPVDQDNAWKKPGLSSTKLHHLEDIAHHPTILGLIASIGVTFFRTAAFVDKEGKWHFVILETNKNEIVKVYAPIIISGIFRWLIHLAESKSIEKTGKELPKPLHKLIVAISYSPAIIQILKVIDNWFGHLVSDMGGSKSTAGGGMGIPGLFISVLKEISSLPFLKDTKLPKFVSDLYSKEKWDLRSEMAIVEYAGKQSIPVILNELLVRTFYFVRHLISEYKKNECWKDIDWNNVVPWHNRTITRMMTISSGTLVVVDAADAAIRAALKSGGEPATLFTNMVLRINFVGVGRFFIAIGTDLYMGYKCDKLRKERMYRQTEQIMLSSARLYYKQAGMWIAAKDTEEAIKEMERCGIEALTFMQNSVRDIGQNLHYMTKYAQDIENNNPGLLSNISNILKYGK